MLGRERSFPLPAGRLFPVGPQPHTRLNGSRQHPRRPACLAAHQAADRHVWAHGRPADHAGLVRDHGPHAIRATYVRLGENLVAGLSNGAIWALVAIGYTLVYGIVELINFAHGEIFMIGSFISASFIATLGLTIDSAAVPVFFGLLVALDRGHGRCGHAQRAHRTSRVQTATQRAEAGAADHRGRHVLHPAERRPSLEGRQPAGRAGPPGRAAHALHRLRRHDRERRHPRGRGHDPAAAS